MLAHANKHALPTARLHQFQCRGSRLLLPSSRVVPSHKLSNRPSSSSSNNNNNSNNSVNSNSNNSSNNSSTH